MTDPIRLDGAMGEGGGQVLRSALSLSLLTGRPFVLSRVRAGRDRPGLRPQHLTAVQAAAQVSGARVDGDRVGSQEIAFAPGPVRPGDYCFDVGTAGATSLVLQTLLLPLVVAEGAAKGSRRGSVAAQAGGASSAKQQLACFSPHPNPSPRWGEGLLRHPLAGGESKVVIRGGTHVPWSPCFHYLDWQWRPFLQRVAIHFDLTLTMAGFYPEGGGELRASIPGGATPEPLGLTERGALREVRGLSAVANLPWEIAERQRRRALRDLAGVCPGVVPEIELEELPASTRGTLLLLLARCEHGQGCCFALGARGKRAEQVADEAVAGLAAFLRSDGAVDPWLADQLLLPLAAATEASALRTSEVTLHLQTNAEVIQEFLPVEIHIDGPLGSPGTIHLRPVPGKDGGRHPGAGPRPGNPVSER